MPLTPRQELSYNHRADLYQPVVGFDADGRPQPVGYSLRFTDVPCRFERLVPYSAPGVLGRSETDILQSLDKIHFAEDQEVDEAWWIQDKSLRPDGTPGNSYGRWWVARGEPQRIIDSLDRDGGKVVVTASGELHPPEGLPLAA